jgi:uncharacterized protein YfaS (alpha-2-macroglobulin family)
LADSVPGGLEPVNRQLAITSEFDANIATFEATKNQSSGDKNASSAFYHSQLRNSSVTFYSERMPSGAQLVSYTAQAVADGEFIALPAHAEEMYAPEVSGDSVAQTIRVEQ